jgi:hypothetical protein
MPKSRAFNAMELPKRRMPSSKFDSGIGRILAIDYL